MRTETSFSRAVLLVALVYVAGAALAHALVRTVGADSQSWTFFLPSAVALGVGLVCIDRRSLDLRRAAAGGHLLGAVVLSGVFAGLAAATHAASQGHSIEMGDSVRALHAAFVAPVVEEIVFTGFLYVVLRKTRGVKASVLWISLLFALAHLPSGVASALTRVSHSVVACLIFECTGSLLLAMAQHFLSNFIPLLFAFALEGRPIFVSVSEPRLAGIAMALLAVSVLIPLWRFSIEQLEAKGGDGVPSASATPSCR